MNRETRDKLYAMFPTPEFGKSVTIYPDGAVKAKFECQRCHYICEHAVGWSIGGEFQYWDCYGCNFKDRRMHAYLN